MIKHNAYLNTFADLCCGVGGFHVAASNLGLDCVVACDIDKNARDIYRKNFGIEPLKDLLKIKPNKLPDFDLLCAGFPCQPFSTMGKQKGLNDPRGRVFFSILNIIKYKKPKIILLENVANLERIENGKIFTKFVSLLEHIGYYVYYKVLNSLDYSLPHNRKRIFIVASKKKINLIWPKPVERKSLKYFLDKKPDSRFLRLKPLIAKLVKKHKDDGSIKQPNIWMRRIGNRKLNEPYGIKIYDYAPCILAADYSSHTVNGKRKLTARERFNLQGFPKYFIISSAITVACKQAGNAVSVPVVQAIIQQIMRATRELNLKNRMETNNDSKY